MIFVLTGDLLLATGGYGRPDEGLAARLADKHPNNIYFYAEMVAADEDGFAEGVIW